MPYEQRQIDNIRAILRGALHDIESAISELDILESRIDKSQKVASGPEWTITPRFDLDDHTWEVSRPSENWTLTITPGGKPVCGCGKEKCEHCKTVLHRCYSPAHPDLDEGDQ